MLLGAVNKSATAHKVIISIVFGLLGFVINFYPVDFVFYDSYRMSFLFGLVFPMLITLSWGWKYGLLSALCGGCQTMWILWFQLSGYGPLVSVPPFTLWIVWLGWFSHTRHNIYIGEIIFRIFNTVLLYTVFRWVFTLNVPPHNVGIPLTVVHSIVFKELVNGLLILFIAQTLLHLGRVRTFFKISTSNTDPRLYYIYMNAVILGGILIFSFVGEGYIWGMWGSEFQNVARILGSLLLLLTGITCTYFTANIFAKRKTGELTLAGEALRESEENFRLLAENSLDCVWTLDTRLKFTYLSPSALERIMGVKVEKWVGTKLRVHFTKKEFLRVGALAIKSLKDFKNHGYVIFETKMLDGKNKEIDVEISSRALFDINGKLIGLQGVTKDITERKQAEKELAKYQEHLEELVKKRTKELEEKNKELERMNNLFAGREFRIKELRDKVKKLNKK